ncbi:MAG: efflux RND transporter periplasmic adaptor subunit [Tannerellaceae bacterium]|nr:efflux RND transporter periplasmic adaptor subunit [Tannerellaceae bacterium]
MVKRNLMFLLFLPITLCWISCGGNKEEENDAPYRFNGNTVYVNPNHVVAEKIETTQVTVEEYSREIITAGSIQPITTQYAYIAPPFAGRITKSHVSIGQTVKENTPLFEIISSDFMETQKEFYQAQSERELALKDMKRKEDLFQNGVASEKELEEAINLLKIAEKEYENARAALNIFHVNPDEMVLGQPMVIRSPIAGNVIENNVVTGLYLKDDAEPVAIVANISQVWVVAQVKEKDLRYIHDDSELKIQLAAYPDKELRGKVFHIDEAVDEETRSVRVLSICDNKDELLKLGMYVTIHFHESPSPHLVIPEKALLQDEKMTFVFVQTAPHTYVKTPVEVEVTKDGKAIIEGGLEKGQTIISAGGYYLK